VPEFSSLVVIAEAEAEAEDLDGRGELSVTRIPQSRSDIAAQVCLQLTPWLTSQLVTINKMPGIVGRRPVPLTSQESARDDMIISPLPPHTYATGKVGFNN
jgi:hypothetical protein